MKYFINQTQGAVRSNLQTEEEEDLSESTINTDDTPGSGDSEVSLSLPENLIQYAIIWCAI